MGQIALCVKLGSISILLRYNALFPAQLATLLLKVIELASSASSIANFATL
jgi:hypothetical protein